MQSIRDFETKDRRVLVRCDFNVPLHDNGSIADDFRIRETLPTIRLLLSKKAKIILLSHLGDPHGKIVENVRLAKVQEKLEELLNLPVQKASDCVGKEIEEQTLRMRGGELLLLENVRFHSEEEQGDMEFAKKLACLGDIYCNDAFSACHRTHASIAGVPKFLPFCAGLLLEKEVNMLGKFSQNPERPFVVIVGGKKIKDKLSFVNHISDRADAVLLGNLLYEEAKKQGMVFRNPQKIVFPVDGVPNSGQALDIGPKTIELFADAIKKAKSIFWTGPLGLVEKEEYVKGSFAVAQAVAENGARAIAGGGDISSFLDAYHFTEKFSYVSTGGGATLEFLAGEELPGLKALGYYGN